MLSYAICDDDMQELSRISILLNKYKELRKIVIKFSLFSNPTELLDTLPRGSYDVLLLDVLMPGVNGIQAAREIREKDQNIPIVFLTSSPEYAVDSYSVDAYYYLLKPITETKLYPILDKLYSEMQQEEKTLLIKSVNGLTRIAFHKLDYVEVMNKKLYFHLSDCTIKEICGSLSDYETELLFRREFIKVHRSYIVNMGNIQELNPGTITTISGQSIPISRLLYSQVRASYMNYLFLEKGVE